MESDPSDRGRKQSAEIVMKEISIAYKNKIFTVGIIKHCNKLLSEAMKFLSLESLETGCALSWGWTS